MNLGSVDETVLRVDGVLVPRTLGPVQVASSRAGEYSLWNLVGAW